MKAIILAGGHATRMWPITKDRSKPLLPLGDRPIIDYMADELVEEDVEQIIISTNQKYAPDFKQYAEEYDRDNLKVIVEDQKSEEEKPGTIGAIIKILDQEAIEDDLLIVGGDNYFPFSFSELFEMFREKEGVINAVYDVEDWDMAKQFGIVDVDEEHRRIIGFKEKPENPPSTLASTACYLFPEEQVSLFHEYEKHFQKNTEVPEDQYLDEPGRLIEWSHKRTPMYAFSFNGDWFDIGTPEGYLKATSSTLDDPLVKGDVDGSDIGDNVVVMEEAKVENSTVENSILFPGSEIKDSNLEGCLVDTEAKIKDKELENSVIGKYSDI